MAETNSYYYRPGFWRALKQDLCERFLSFESFNGAFVYIPWGTGFFYYGFPWEVNSETFYYIITRPEFGYNYAMITTGMVLMFWGVRKALVNRVKQQAALNIQLEQRKEADAE